MDIFAPRGNKVTAAFSLTEAHVREIEKIAKRLGQSKSAVVDQLIGWGLDRYRKEAAKRG